MINYYKFTTSSFKVNTELKTIEHVNNSDTKSMNHITSVNLFDGMIIAITRDNWETITEEQFNTAKADILSYLSSL